MSTELWREPGRAKAAAVIAQLVDDNAPLVRVRTLTDGGGGLDRDFIARAAPHGAWPAQMADGELMSACILGEELGRILSPEPWVEAHVVLDTLAREGSALQRNETMPALRAGELVACWASNDLTGYWGGGNGVHARRDGNDFVLDGVASAVQHASDADVMMLAAHEDEGVSLFLVPLKTAGVKMKRLDGLDITRPRFDVAFSGFRAAGHARVGDRGGAAQSIARQVRLAVPLALSQSIGAMAHLVDAAIAHAKSRIAFGRPIGSFQAVKHMLVDAALGLETCAAMRDAGVDAIVAGQSDADEIVSMAKACMARTSLEVAHAAWQVFGGIAYMWENDFHLYLRRITAEAAVLGGEVWHNERVCRLHGLARDRSGEVSA